MERVRLTALEVMTLRIAFEKLLNMNPKARRACEGWQIVKTALLKTGNWKRAPRGKPNSLFGSKSAFLPARETAYVPTGTYD